MASILARWLGRPRVPETRGQTLDVLAAAYGFRLGHGAIGAENLAAVAACVQAIAGTIGSLPVRLYARNAKGRTEITDHPMVDLLRAPNPWQTGPDFLEGLLASTLLHGNGVAVVDHDAAGQPTALLPVRWDRCHIAMLPSGRLAYDCTLPSEPFGPSGPPRRYFQGDVLHLKDRGDSALIGRSRLSRSPGPIENADGLQIFSNEMWRSGTAPAGTLRTPKTLGDAARKRLKGDMSEFAGVQRSRRLLLLEEGLEYDPISLVPEQAEVLASRRFSVEEIARLYAVPPSMIGDLTHGTFSNVETLGRQFAMFCLAPWCRKLEAVIERTLLSPGLEIEIDLSGLMRGDYAARWAANVAAHQAGLLTANEIREGEGFPPIAGGDHLRVMPGEPGTAPAGTAQRPDPVP